MTNFVKVADEGNTCDFINLDHVTQVQCSVKRTGGGVKIESVGEGKTTTSAPTKTLAIITLCTIAAFGLNSEGQTIGLIGAFSDGTLKTVPTTPGGIYLHRRQLTAQEIDAADKKR